jgi:hypothetical protein
MNEQSALIEIELDGVETRKLAVVSTAHMKASDAKLLQDGVEPDGFYMRGEYGWQFYNSEDFCPYMVNWGNLGFSQEFLANLRCIFAAGYDRVEFDQDGPVIETLQSFEW